MSYRFIVGNAGSGRTRSGMDYLLKQSANDKDRSYLYIVPEQFTMQSQKALVQLHPSHSVMDIDILSFKRLAFKVFRELGTDSVNVLEDTGKNLILRKLAGDNRDSLKVLSKHIGNMSYIDEIKSFICEMMQYGVGVNDLKNANASGRLSPLLLQKTSDIILLYEKFLDYIKGEYVTAEQLLELLSDVVYDSLLLKDAVIVFDGFTGFTPIQNEIISKLMSVCSELIFIVTMDANEAHFTSIREEEMYYMSKNYISSIRKMGDEKSQTEGKMLVLSDERIAKDTFVYETKTPKDELILVAETIIDRVKNKNARFKDLAIVSGNQDIYLPYMEDVFSKYNIPYFCDKTLDLTFHPVVGFLKNICELCLYGFKQSNVISLIKNPLFGMGLYESDIFENYLLATGIKGIKRFSNAFTLKPNGVDDEDLNELNTIRESILEKLLPFYEKYKSKKKEYLVHDMNVAIYELMEVFCIEEKLFEKDEESIYGLIIDSLEKMETLLSKESMTFEEYVEVLFSGLSADSLGSLPKTADMVVFGDTIRTRLDDIDTLFIIGANEGILPPVSLGGGLFSGKDRQILKECDINLADSDRERQFAGSFYMYLSLSRPNKELFVSFSTLDFSGSSLRPSFIVEKLCKDRGLEIKKYEAKDEVTGIVLNIDESDVLNEKILRAIDKGTISASVSRLEAYSRCSYAYYLNYILRLKEKSIYGMSRLDLGNIYHDGLYNFFVFLKEEKLDIATISEQKKSELVAKSIDMAYQKIENTADYDNPYEKYIKAKMLDTLENNVNMLIHQIEKSSFRPAYFESNLNRICDKEDLIIELKNNTKLMLNGVIDRIDLFKDENSIYIKIIDYKSGKNKIEYEKLYNGIQIQLVYYLDVTKKALLRKNPNMRIVPSAMFYYHIDDPIKEISAFSEMDTVLDKIKSDMRPEGLMLDSRESIDALDNEFSAKGISDIIKAKLTRNGSFDRYSRVLSENDLEYLMGFVQKKVVSTATDISMGKIQKNPFRIDGDTKDTACAYCPYHGICSFEPGTDSYNEIHTIKDIGEFKSKDGI